MKKPNIRSIGWITLTVLSLACYGYLNQCTPESDLVYMEENMTEEFEENQNPERFLPEIALVKKLINITKIVMPKD